VQGYVEAVIAPVWKASFEEERYSVAPYLVGMWEATLLREGLLFEIGLL
jgi:hypothetical protein